MLGAALALSAAGCGDDEAAPTRAALTPDVNDVSGPVVTGCCGGAVADPATNGLRLSLVSNVAVPKADTIDSTTAYFVPFESSTIALYESGAWIARTMTTTASVANDGVSANTSYDVYAYWSGTVVLLEKVATPGTPTLVLQDGVQVKAGDAKRRYVGVLATNAAGKFEDSAKNRLVWNRNNQVPRDVSGVDLNAWYYTGPAWREVRGNAASRVTVAAGILNGSAGISGAYASVQAVGMCVVSGGGSTAYVASGIGIDSQTTNSAQVVRQHQATTTVYAHSSASYEGYLAPGIRTISWLEGAQSAAITFYCIGAATSPPFGKLGMSGSIVM